MAKEEQQCCAHNICCILWCVIDVGFCLSFPFSLIFSLSSSLSLSSSSHSSLSLSLSSSSLTLTFPSHSHSLPLSFSSSFLTTSQTAVKLDLYLEPHPWLAAARSILFSAMSSLFPLNRRLAAEALSQLCLVTEESFVTGVIGEIQQTLKQHADLLKESACVYCLCSIQRFISNHNNTSLSQLIIRILVSECADYTQPLRTWVLYSLAIYLNMNELVRDRSITRWILLTVNHNILCDGGGSGYTERVTVELALLRVVYGLLSVMDRGIVETYKYDFVTLFNIIDYVSVARWGDPKIWSTCNDSQVLESCLQIYSVLFELCPSFLQIPVIVDRIRRSLIGSDMTLRCADTRRG